MAKITTVEKPNNSILRKAAKAKQDEFYTQLTDIEKELKNYKQHFKDKVVYCNCDDPIKSNFFTYFMLNFKKLGLKKLITTCYKSQDEQLHSKNNSKNAIYLEYTGNPKTDGKPDVIKHTLIGNGDFKSDECIALLKQADIVVTNPPFSLFREYIAQLVEYDKKYIVIGNTNSITYKDIFPLIKNNKLWLGCTNFNVGMFFEVPGSCEHFHHIEETAGKKIARVSTACWYTNIDTNKRHESIVLYKKYTAKEYPKYDNYNAINIDKVAEIPSDYFDLMGVPITFLDKYNPEQFEILGITTPGSDMLTKTYSSGMQITDKGIKSKILSLDRGPVLEVASPPTKKTYYIIDNKYYIVNYARILIKRKQ